MNEIRNAAAALRATAKSQTAHARSNLARWVTRTDQWLELADALEAYADLEEKLERAQERRLAEARQAPQALLRRIVAAQWAWAVSDPVIHALNEEIEYNWGDMQWDPPMWLYGAAYDKRPACEIVAEILDVPNPHRGSSLDSFLRDEGVLNAIDKDLAKRGNR